MAGFETIVRPSVLPNIRPSPAQPVSSSDPEQGKAIISGSSGGQAIDLHRSETYSWSRTKPVETQRTVTKQRVYQKEDDGSVNKENFVDVEHVTSMKTREGDGTTKQHDYAKPQEADNIETLESGMVQVNQD